MDKNKHLDNGSWKDKELDSIWNHGLKLVQAGKLHVYDCLTYIENQMQLLLDRELTQARTEALQEVLELAEKLKMNVDKNVINYFEDEPTTSKILELNKVFNRGLELLRTQLKEKMENLKP